MKKDQEPKSKNETPRHPGLLDSKSYFLAKQWLMKAYLRSWQTLNPAKKRK